MKQLSDYIDSFGMVTTKVKDGGDSCAYTCAMLYGVGNGTGLNALIFETRPDELEIEPGLYVRHPDQTKWYSLPNVLSRDQLTPLLIDMGLHRFDDKLERLFKRHLKRGLLFAWNTRTNGIPRDQPAPWKFPDVTGPEIWALWIRAFRIKWLYPLLILFDLFTLGGSIIYRYFSNNTLQMNHILITDFSTRVMPTWTSLLARWIYGKKVALNALKVTFTDYADNPPVDQYLIPLVQSWKVRN